MRKRDNKKLLKNISSKNSDDLRARGRGMNGGRRASNFYFKKESDGK